ncbi:MAG: hypothetical protein P8Y21_03810 [Gemmatimonadales bacterium]|jgi:hypothetical protein
MRGLKPRVMTVALLSAGLSTGCSPDRPPEEPDEASRYLFVWAGDPDPADSDFLAVIDVDPASGSYGEVLATAPVGLSSGAHHTEHAMPEGGRLFANGFRSGRSWVINLRDPLAPFVEATFDSVGPYTYPHSFERTPGQTVLATFQNRGEGNRLPGALVELDSLGGLIRASDAADATDPELRPYSLAISAELDRVASTTSDMRAEHVGRSVQLWSLSDLELLHTLLLPPGPRGDEHLHPAEPRFLDDGQTLIVSTFNCGLYLVSDVASGDPGVEHIYTFPRDRESDEECSLPVHLGRFWVQTVDHTRSIFVLDLSDPRHPALVDELELEAEAVPHWISLEPSGHRIVLTGSGTLSGRVVLLRIDPESGKLSVIDDFGPGGRIPGLDMNRADWPHGRTGPVRPHGAVFSLP